jgi:predicted MPP superfamily phosphohydrolase
VPPGAWAEQLAGLEAPLGVYSILGNHDWWSAAIPTEPADDSLSVRRALAAAGVPLLENQSVRLSQAGRPFWLIGLGDLLARVPHPRRGHGADDLPAALREINDDAPAILLVHEPYLFPWVPDRIALTLAGHMHGGQVNLPMIGAPLHLLKRRSSKYIYGEYALGERRMIVSGGLGTSLAPVRVLCPPEVVMVKLGGGRRA